ncbi:hypothetical protein AK812_SmicGene36110 [Symbiodinium microadriaticum]|uniref:Uncharacterized protein n=1 Tax=Symbiodinium microadriaticum TaxID=2951 RepID=A0A1Q9CJS5_SYMMI|nr:hypothetical protein AK812_SmicGene36110 [Symbiodinium microadriaticum]
MASSGFDSAAFADFAAAAGLDVAGATSGDSAGIEHGASELPPALSPENRDRLVAAQEAGANQLDVALARAGAVMRRCPLHDIGGDDHLSNFSASIRLLVPQPIRFLDDVDLKPRSARQSLTCWPAAGAELFGYAATAACIVEAAHPPEPLRRRPLWMRSGTHGIFLHYATLFGAVGSGTKGSGTVSGIRSTIQGRRALSSRLEFVAGGLPDVLLLLAALIGWAGAARAVLAITVLWEWDGWFSPGSKAEEPKLTRRWHGATSPLFCAGGRLGGQAVASHSALVVPAGVRNIVALTASLDELAAAGIPAVALLAAPAQSSPKGPKAFIYVPEILAQGYGKDPSVNGIFACFWGLTADRGWCRRLVGRGFADWFAGRAQKCAPRFRAVCPAGRSLRYDQKGATAPW